MAGSPFAVDWTDIEAVKAYADELGSGNVVLSYPDRPNYNIAPELRKEDIADGAIVMYVS